MRLEPWVLANLVNRVFADTLQAGHDPRDPVGRVQRLGLPRDLDQPVAAHPRRPFVSLFL